MGAGAPCADPGPFQMVGQPFGHLTAAGVPHAYKENLHGTASWRLRCFFRLAHSCFKTFYHSTIARLAAPGAQDCEISNRGVARTPQRGVRGSSFVQKGVTSARPV